MDAFGSERKQLASSCVHGNESSGSAKDRESIEMGS
jgi:hypothetical protein